MPQIGPPGLQQTSLRPALTPSAPATPAPTSPQVKNWAAAGKLMSQITSPKLQVRAPFPVSLPFLFSLFFPFSARIVKPARRWAHPGMRPNGGCLL